MITIFFYQSVLFIFIYFLGKKISSKINLIFKFTTNSIFLNFLLSLFLITLIPFIFNFFIPITNEFIYLTFFSLLAWSILSLKLTNTDKKNVLLLVMASFLLIPLVLNIDIGHDAGLYHVPFQTWIKNYKITLGLSNLHTRYALTSAYDYLSIMFWINNFFTINALLQSCFLIIFFSFFYEMIKGIKKSIFLICFIPIIILFPIWQRYVIFDYGSVDFSFGILSMLLTIQLIKILNLKIREDILLQEYFIFFILLTYVLLSKATGVIFLFLLFILILDIIKSKKYFLLKKNLIIFIFLSFIIIFLWFLKNFIISGCLVYPITQVCFDTSWFDQQNLTRDLSLISNYKEHYSTFINYIYMSFYNLKYLLVFTILTILFAIWVNQKKSISIINNLVLTLSTLVLIFFVEINSLRGFSDISSLASKSGDYLIRDNQIFIEMIRLLATITASILLSIAIIKKYNNIKLKFNLYNQLVFSFILISFVIWFSKSPDPRLGFWIFALLPSIFLFSVINIESNLLIKKLKYVFNSIIIFNLIFIFTLNSFEILKKNKKITLINYNKIIINNSIIIKRDNFGYKPVVKRDENGVIPDFTWNYCWNYIDCYYNEKDVNIQKLFFGYKKIVTLNH